MKEPSAESMGFIAKSDEVADFRDERMIGVAPIQEMPLEEFRERFRRGRDQTAISYLPTKTPQRLCASAVNLFHR